MDNVREGLKDKNIGDQKQRGQEKSCKRNIISTLTEERTGEEENGFL